jgi:hypothetical protein
MYKESLALSKLQVISTCKHKQVESAPIQMPGACWLGKPCLEGRPGLYSLILWFGLHGPPKVLVGRQENQKVRFFTTTQPQNCRAQASKYVPPMLQSSSAREAQ